MAASLTNIVAAPLTNADEIIAAHGTCPSAHADFLTLLVCIFSIKSMKRMASTNRGIPLKEANEYMIFHRIKSRKLISLIAALGNLLLSGCGTAESPARAENPALEISDQENLESESPEETLAPPSPEPSCEVPEPVTTPAQTEDTILVIFEREEIKQELYKAICDLRQPRRMDVSHVSLGRTRNWT